MKIQEATQKSEKVKQEYIIISKERNRHFPDFNTFKINLKNFYTKSLTELQMMTQR